MKIVIFTCLFISSHAHVVRRIVGGYDASQDEFLNLVSLQIYKNELSAYEHFCGGAVLDKFWILTAAHCIDELNNFPLDNVTVMAGTLNIVEWVPFRQISNVEKYFKHDKYNFVTFLQSYDVGLIKLVNALRLHQRLRPFPLANKFECEGKAMIAGWGDVFDKNPIIKIASNNLKAAEVDIVDYRTCKEAVKKIIQDNGEEYSDEYVHPAHICTGPLTGGKSPCTGDSGGPLLQKNAYGEYEVIGIISFIAVPCGRPGGISLHSNIYSHISWIHNITKK